MKFAPEPAPKDVNALSVHIERLEERLAAAFTKIHDLEESHAAPGRIFDGLIRYADGVNWNPGAGEGVYARVNGRWVPMTTGSYFLDVSAGDITGSASVNKFGQNDTVASGTTETVWDGGGTYAFPSTADITHIKSSNSADTSITYEVTGLDDNYTLTTQDATTDATDGQTLVALTTALRRCFRIKIKGASGAAGDVSVVNSGDTTTYAKVLSGNNQTLMSVYTIPAGKTGYLWQYYGSIIRSAVKNPDSIRLTLWFQDRSNNYDKQLKHVFGVEKNGSSILTYRFPHPVKVTEKTDVWIDATAVGADADVSAGFELTIIDN